jgi:hypothetical protein
MAKALFHKNQKVYVRPVGTWAIVERVLPQWVKGMDEPLRVHYDVGLGREFSAQELTAEDTMNKRNGSETDLLLETWRVFRAKNRWGNDYDNADHPFPGTFPVVQTDENDWGGWRVPGAEYDRDPQRIEYQARLISNAPQMLKLIKKFVDGVSAAPENYSAESRELARTGVYILRHVYDVPEVLPSKAAE